MEILKKYWVVILIVIIVALLIWYFYKKGKSSPNTTKPVLDIINSTNPNNNPVGLSNAEIRSIVTLAFADYDSYVKSFLGTHDEDLYFPIAQMSDTDFGRAYNIWNTEYQATNGRTMIQAIDSISWWSGGAYTSVRDIILQKAARLGLK